MLFFSDQLSHLFETKNRTSPVRSSRIEKRIWQNCILGLRKRASLSASLTIEAALVFPLFCFSCLCLIAPIRLFDQQRRFQAVLEEAGEELSRLAYLKEVLEGGGGEIREGQEAAVSAFSLLAVRQKVKQAADERMVSDLTLLGSQLSQDGMIRLRLRYRFKLPVAIFGISDLAMENVCARRAWVGAEGGRRREGTGSVQDPDDPIVYVGKDGTRYHVDAYCHYLVNNLRRVDVGEVENLRNAVGKKYYPCNSCATGNEQGSVYIMESGSSYHVDSECKAIMAYSRAVPLSEVSHLGACSYCGGGQ